MTKADRRRTALAAIDRAAKMLASASHDYEMGGYDMESAWTYDRMCEVRELYDRLKPQRRTKARK